MARTTKRGKCELCGEVANVGTNHGSATCPKCTHVQAALANRLQAVAKAARAMGKAEDLIKALIPDGGSLAVQVTATLLQEISGIVGYDGENPAELVEAVREATATKKATALDCGDCDLAGCFNELAELVDLRGASSGLIIDRVRAMAGNGGAECNNEELRLRDDLARACDMGQDYSHRWGSVAQGAIQTIGELLNRWHRLQTMLMEARAESASLRNEVARLNNVTKFEDAETTQLRAKLILAEQARDEWEQRAVQAEQNVETLEAEVKEADSRNGRLQYQLAGYAPEPCASATYLLDIALRALRGEGPDADQLANLIEAARRAA